MEDSQGAGSLWTQRTLPLEREEGFSPPPRSPRRGWKRTMKTHRSVRPPVRGGEYSRPRRGLLWRQQGASLLWRWRAPPLEGGSCSPPSSRIGIKRPMRICRHDHLRTLNGLKGMAGVANPRRSFIGCPIRTTGTAARGELSHPVRVRIHDESLSAEARLCREKNTQTHKNNRSWPSRYILFNLLFLRGYGGAIY